MKILNHVKQSLRSLSVFERILWAVSAAVVTFSFFLGDSSDPTVLIATLVGVTALIFTAKGDVIGQVFIIIFALLYAVVSYKQAYYGEMISYIFMSGGIAVFSVISWLKHPYAEGQVKVGHPSKLTFIILGFLTLAITFAFYFILDALNTANMLFSTISIATSFAASSLTLLRSPLYAAAYALNDIVLIILWSAAAVNDPGAFPMIICFVTFLVNDINGLISWLRMERLQQKFKNR